MEQALPLPKFSLTPGWICLGIATLSGFLLGPLLGSIIAGPLTIAALVLSIIGMTRNNVAGGVVLMVLTFILPPIAFLVSFFLAFIPAKKSHAIDWRETAPGESIAR